MSRQTSLELALSPDQEALLTPRVRWYTKLIAKRIAYRCYLPSAEREELINIGLFNLPQIARRFDPSRGVKFLTFATWRLRGCMLDYLRTTMNYGFRRKHWAKAVSLSESQSLERIFYGGRSGKTADTDPVSAETKAWLKQLYLNENNPGKQAEQQQLLKRVEQSLGSLPLSERTVITLYYFDELTLEEIGARINRTKSWTCRLHQRALAKLHTILAKD